MKTGRRCNHMQHESAAANMIEYIMISGVLMGLLMVMLLLVNTNIMENPANRLAYVAFTDIGNGVSTRMVDLYSLAPRDGRITTRFDIPDEIAGKDYSVEVGTRANLGNSENTDQYIRISRGYITTDIALSGIAANPLGNATGSTTGRGMNKISYDSKGV